MDIVAIAVILSGTFVTYAALHNNNPSDLVKRLVTDPANFRANLTSRGTWVTGTSPQFVAGTSLAKAEDVTGKGTSDGRSKVVASPDGAFAAPVVGALGSPFGMRNGSMHNGQDIPIPVGTPVHAAMSGTVILPYSAASAGNNLAIQSGTVTARYLHLSRKDVSVGDSVRVGDVIGLSGNTGRSTGPHLHFQIDVLGAPTEPVAWMAAHGVKLGGS